MGSSPSGRRGGSLYVDVQGAVIPAFVGGHHPTVRRWAWQPRACYLEDLPFYFRLPALGWVAMGEALISKSDTALLPGSRLPKPVGAGRRYTYDEVLAEFPETNQPCELCDGELIFMASPSFYHQEVALSFYRSLFDWVSARKLGKVVASPIDMVLSPHQVRQPDVAYIARERLHIIGRVINGPVDLAAEITSLDGGGRQRDRFDKRDLYEQHGIKEYWMIDPDARTVEVLFLQGGTYVLHGRYGIGASAQSRLLEGFGLAVDGLFASAIGG